MRFSFIYILFLFFSSTYLEYRRKLYRNVCFVSKMSIVYRLFCCWFFVCSSVDYNAHTNFHFILFLTPQFDLCVTVSIGNCSIKLHILHTLYSYIIFFTTYLSSPWNLFIFVSICLNVKFFIVFFFLVVKVEELVLRWFQKICDDCH